MAMDLSPNTHFPPHFLFMHGHSLVELGDLTDRVWHLYLYLYLFLLGVRVAYIPNGFFNPIVYSSL